MLSNQQLSSQNTPALLPSAHTVASQFRTATVTIHQIVYSSRGCFMQKDVTHFCFTVTFCGRDWSLWGLGTDVRAAAAVLLQKGTDINAALAAAERGKQTAKTHLHTCTFLLERWCAPSLHPHGRPYKYALLFAQRRSQSGLLRAHDAITSSERE